MPALPQAVTGTPLPPKPTRDFNAERAALEQQRTDLTGQHEQAMTGAKQTLDEKRAPLQSGLDQKLGELDAELAKPNERVPLPEKTAQHLDPKQLSEAASIWMTLGAFAGLMTRTPMTAALGNMTAAMKGAQEGDMAQFKQHYDAWDSSFKEAMSKNKDMLAKKKEILDDIKLSLTQKEHALKLVDSEYGSIPQKLETSFLQRNKSIDAQIGMTDKAEQAAEKIRESVDKRLQQHEDKMAIENMRHEDRQSALALRQTISNLKHPSETPGGAAPSLGGASAPGDKGDEAVRFWAQAVIAGDKDWQVGLSRSKGGSELIEKVKRMVPVMAKELGLDPQDIGSERSKNAALTATMKDLTKRKEAVELFSGKLEKDMRTLDGLLDSAGMDSPLLVNQPINYLRRKFSDESLNKLDLAAKQVGTEYERLITGGTLSVAQLHAGAQEDAKSLINGNMTPKQSRAIMEVMRMEIKNARDAAHESQGRITEQMHGLGRGKPAAGGWSIRPK